MRLLTKADQDFYTAGRLDPEKVKAIVARAVARGLVTMPGETPVSPPKVEQGKNKLYCRDCGLIIYELPCEHCAKELERSRAQWRASL